MTSRLSGVPACPVAVLPVVLTVGSQTTRQRQRIAGLGVPALQLQRPAEAEEGVVVGRCAPDDRLELLLGLAEAAGAEERPAQGLPDRRLVRLEVARPLQRDGGGVAVAVLQ